MNDRTGKLLWTIGIIFFGLATVMNVLGGIGTICAAFYTEDYPSYSALIDEGMQWLYQVLVLTTVIVSLVGIWVLIELIKGRNKAFRNALIVLIIGTLLAGIQYFSSLQLFGKAAPANIKFYCNLLALIIFLILLIPGIRERVRFTYGNSGIDNSVTGGLSAIMMGIILLTTPFWVGQSHTYQGVNWVNLLLTELNLTGVLLIGIGTSLLIRGFVAITCQENVYRNLKIHH